MKVLATFATYSLVVGMAFLLLILTAWDYFSFKIKWVLGYRIGPYVSIWN